MYGVFSMKRCVQTDIVLQVMELLSGEQFRAIEAAKHLIADAVHVDPDLLAKVVLDKEYKPWSKTMSAYVLGFLPATAETHHQLVLREVLSNPALSVRLRDHAAEALGNMHDEDSVPLLAERLADKGESKSVRKSCIYALSQLTSTAASTALQHFAATAPTGILAQELTATATP